MASTEVEIANSALIKVGAQLITSLNDNVKGARIIKEQLPKLRDELILSHPWNFAIKRVELAALVTAPIQLQEPDDFRYQLQLPNDVLRVLDTDILFPQPWQIEGDKLLANNNTVKIKYLAQITDPSKWTATFSEVLSLRLAADVSYSLVQSVTLSQQLYALFERKLGEARSYDAQEGRVKRVESDEIFNRRF